MAPPAAPGNGHDLLDSLMAQRKGLGNFPQRRPGKVEPPDRGVVLCAAQERLPLGFRESGAGGRGVLQEVRVCHHRDSTFV
jgi:hypothetical protein